MLTRDKRLLRETVRFFSAERQKERQKERKKTKITNSTNKKKLLFIGDGVASSSAMNKK